MTPCIISAMKGMVNDMDNEKTYETYIAVNKPIEVLAGILGAELHDATDPDGPVRFAQVRSASVKFTIFSYRDRPAWSHLQSSVPFDEESVAEFLSSMGLKEDMIDVAVDEENMPIQDIDAIREKVAQRRATTRH